MAGKDQQFFCESVKKLYPEHFKNRNVLDLGSLDINGNNRYLFEDCKYLGVDIGEGPNVDMISKAHELVLPSKSFDVIISTEMLEHDPYWEATLINAFRMLRNNGLMILTMGGLGRKEHGTIKSIPEDSPFTSKIESWATYYRNLLPEDILNVLKRTDFDIYTISINNIHKDLYFYGIKK